MRLESFRPQQRRRGKRSRIHSLGFAVAPLEDHGLGTHAPTLVVELDATAGKVLCSAFRRIHGADGIGHLDAVS